MTNEFIYLQFFKALNLPIYIEIEPQSFTNHLLSFLESMKFTQLDEAEVLLMKENINSNSNTRLLKIKEASYKLSKQIESVYEGDKFGIETITSRPAYNVYRFKSLGLLMYSFSSRTWELGCYEDFGEDIFKARIVMNRFLGWSLSRLGFLGIWGVPVDEGVVVLSPRESQGEAIFLNFLDKKILTVDGSSTLKSRYKILRLDSMIKNKNITMGQSELMSFLSVNTTYLDPKGLSLPIRQMLLAISKNLEGLAHPRDSYKPKTDLSY